MHFACDSPDFSLRCDVGDNLALRLSGSLFDQAPVPGLIFGSENFHICARAL